MQVVLVVRDLPPCRCQREDYPRHYHKRSNVESTFSMVKRKFGDGLRSKSDAAMVSETLAKLLCHNLCCLISAWYELGIEPTDWGSVGKPCRQGVAPLILRFPGSYRPPKSES